jgi:hypothetical protein
MGSLLKQFSKNKYRSHTIAFLLMTLAPVALYYAVQQQATAWIWILIGAVILGNLITILTE